jgi:CBS domain-containing protein
MFQPCDSYVRDLMPARAALQVPKQVPTRHVMVEAHVLAERGANGNTAGTVWIVDQDGRPQEWVDRCGAVHSPVQKLAMGHSRRPVLVSVQEDAPVTETLRLLGESRVDVLPVVNSNGKLVGEVSLRSICRFLESRWR